MLRFNRDWRPGGQHLYRLNLVEGQWRVVASTSGRLTLAPEGQLVSGSWWSYLSQQALPGVPIVRT